MKFLLTFGGVSILISRAVVVQIQKELLGRVTIKKWALFGDGKAAFCGHKKSLVFQAVL